MRVIMAMTKKFRRGQGETLFKGFPLREFEGRALICAEGATKIGIKKSIFPKGSA
ncbi:MAG: hypothetical protein K6C68_03495 [Ruminococcus sp.]|nr:hypothetical protein [Ruminococcus sp.]